MAFLIYNHNTMYVRTLIGTTIELARVHYTVEHSYNALDNEYPTGVH